MDSQDILVSMPKIGLTKLAVPTQDVKSHKDLHPIYRFEMVVEGYEEAISDTDTETEIRRKATKNADIQRKRNELLTILILC